MIEAEVDSFEALRHSLEEGLDERYVITVLAADEETGSLSVRLVERRTGLALNLLVPYAALAGREFQSLRRVHHRMKEMVGQPPFTLRLGQRKAEAPSYEDLRVQS